MHVISTAGHVDHGKSALIERLTGIDPDRLAEEKARGLTIDLGFAWLTLPSGREAGIVDVPGHERFVHNMLAGVGSVDTALFVVAANEGWMPQSEEHLQILDLLGARSAIVALTKIDLVAPPELTRIKRETADRLARTPLEHAPIIPCSARTGEGIDELVAAIDDMLARAGDPADRARPRLCVDRSFTIKGAGTVVTGTLTGGRLRVGDEVIVLPSVHRARIRSIQSHKASRDEAVPVSRVALNLAGLERAEIRRGDAVVLPGQWQPSRVLDVHLRAVRSLDHALTNRGSFKAYVGSAEVDARLSLYEFASLKAGGESFARITLAEPIVVAPHDRIVLRDTGRRATVAGGMVLDAHPPERKRTERTAQLAARAAASIDDIATLTVAERGVVARAELPRLAGTDAEPQGAATTRSFVLSKEQFDELVSRIESALAAFHKREPLGQGMQKDEARVAAAIDDPKLFGELVESLQGRVVADGPLVRLATHRVSLDPEQEAARARLLDDLRESGNSPPTFTTLCARHGEKLARAMLASKELIKIAEDIVFGAEQLDAAKEQIAESIAHEGPLTAARIKDVLGTTRKYAIPLLEYLDSTGFTRRNGDLRALA